MEKKEAMKILKDFHDKSALFSVRTALDTIIPELKESEESEDERIRKALRERIINYDPNDEILIKEEGISQRQFLAWLEKQNQNLEKLKLEKGKWYFCIEDYHPRADCTDFYQGEKYRCEKDGVMGIWCIKNPEKYFRECKTPTYAGSDSVRIQSIIQVLEYARSLSAYNQFGKDDITKDIAWLEKQEQKIQGKLALEAVKEEKSDNQNCVKPAKVEPKFRAGDKVIGIISGIQYYIIKVCDNHYCTESGCIIMFGAQNNFELVEQQLKEIEQKPTDEEMKTLLQTEYEKGRADAIAEMQKSWSEEDEKILDEVITNYESGYLPSVEKRDEIIEKLESFKERHTWKPTDEQNWSEEDETMITDLSVIVHTYFSEISGIPFKYDLSEDKIRTWLKSLRPQWKPSDEQMEALHTYIYNPQYFSSPDPRMELVESIYKDLKKLMEE